jgi:hypothetical protein
MLKAEMLKALGEGVLTSGGVSRSVLKAKPARA